MVAGSRLDLASVAANPWGAVVCLAGILVIRGLPQWLLCRHTPSNETLFGDPGRFSVVVSYGIHHCVNVEIVRADWANGVVLRAPWLAAESERIAAGPALLAKRFGICKRHDATAVVPGVSASLASSGPTALMPTPWQVPLAL